MGKVDKSAQEPSKPAKEQKIVVMHWKCGRVDTSKPEPGKDKLQLS